MTNIEDIFQDRIKRLNAGESLAQCQEGLPPEDADLLALIAQMQTIEPPVRHAHTVAQQRATVMRLATNKKKDSFIMNVSNLWQKLTAQPKLVGGLAVLALICFFALFNFRGQEAPNSTELAADPTPPAAVTNNTSATNPTTNQTVTTNDQTTELVATLPEGLFLPLIAASIATNPQKALLQNAQGWVEVQDNNGSWSLVTHNSYVYEGQTIRTGPLSTANILFHDGSHATLKAQSELTLSTLNVRLPRDGYRQLVLTQNKGVTTHNVAFRNDGGSQYQVNTPSGSGVARGTEFQVALKDNEKTRFVVTEGRVDVSNANKTVSVVAGQTTEMTTNNPPADPYFTITGQGEVTAINESDWVVAGQTFVITDDTTIDGDPQVGDIVYVEGHLLPDGTAVADSIALVVAPPANQFTLTGEAEAIDTAEWQVAGQTILTNADTEIDDDIETGDLVRVTGLIQEDGSLLATSIEEYEANDTYPFEFTGIVQTIDTDSWLISGVEISVDDETEIEGGILAGDTVAVEGNILEDGRWLATEISLVEADTATFEITGELDSMDPWQVAGLPFEITDWTTYPDDLELGELVVVTGRILSDGTWVADSIERIEDGLLEIVFVGTVDSVDPWLVNTLPLTTDENSDIAEGIEVGDLVRVKVRIETDGSWLILEMTLLSNEDEDNNCVTITAVVTNILNDEIVLSNGTTIPLDEWLDVEGDLQVGSVVAIIACVNEDGTITIERIIVIYNPPPTPEDPDDDDDNPGTPDGGTVTICHKPGTPAEKTMTLPQSALNGHLGHGDTMGACP